MIPGTLFFGRYGSMLGRTRRADGTPISFGLIYGAPIEVEQRAEGSEGFAECVCGAHFDLGIPMCRVGDRNHVSGGRTFS